MPRITTICTLDSFVKSHKHMPAQTAVAHWEGPFFKPEDRFIKVDILGYFREKIENLTDNDIFHHANQFIRSNPNDSTFLEDLLALLKEVKPDYVPYVFSELGRYNPKLNDECARLAA